MVSVGELMDSLKHHKVLKIKCISNLGMCNLNYTVLPP